MSDSRYSYDDSTEVWPYFVITLASVVTIPLTFAAISRLTARDDPRSKAPFISRFSPSNKAQIDNFKTKAKSSKLFTKLYVVIVG